MKKICSRFTLSLLLIILFYYSVSLSDASCEICRRIVDDFKKGLEKTQKSNFGGGNTNWEEKSLGKWKTSETRLVEIVEHHMCQGDDKKIRTSCHMFYENNEEALEDWYFNTYKDEDTPASLHNHLCVKSSKVCCPENTYGKKCDPCPTSPEGVVCSGHGKCQGEGTRGGDGSCKCDSGYTSDLCNECTEGYYEQLTGNIQQCLACDKSCEDTCTGAGPRGCDECKDGYEMDEALGCKDIDECTAGTDMCEDEESTYCYNTLGSHTCKPCHASCLSCNDATPRGCTECKTGYEKTTPQEKEADLGPFECTDVNECLIIGEDDTKACSHISDSVCINTEGSFDCVCEGDKVLEGDACKPKQEERAQADKIDAVEDKESTDSKDEL